ncbi:MAG: endonuclease [Bacteroidales bacterium]|nr:endonuclease [Bacteroidales bacterium]
MSIAVFAYSQVFATIPSGYYYFARNKSKAELKTALHAYCAPLHVLDYGGGTGFTWEGFYYTDRNADGSVVDMYSSTVRMFNGFAAVSGMHIEHSLPKSWWGAHENNAYKDLFHLYPADGVTNSTKNNLPLGEVTGTPSLDNGVSKVGKNGFGTAYTDGCFEPADEYKGDFARSYFYIATVYENLAPLWQSPMMNNNTYPVWKSWAKELLLKWHRQDPVSAKERNRIEAVYNIQGNRNPFIDYPDLVEYIWGADTTRVFPFPDETEAFLLTPRRGESIDFGVILQNDSRTRNLQIQGVNISSDVSARLKNNTTAFSLSRTSIPAAEVLNGANVSLGFSPAISGFFRDTLIIENGGLVPALEIPLKALASADFITLEPDEITPVGGNLKWISDPQATGYLLNLYQGDQQAGDLIISSYMEGSSWNKAIELYNGTGKSVDLSKYTLQKQSNGAGDFGSTLKLNGTLANNSTYVIRHKDATNTTLIAKSNLSVDSLLQFNGNDAIQLVRSGVTIDMAGHANAGADVIWGLDLTLKRKPTVTHPLSTFNPLEWESYPADYFDKAGSHSVNFEASSVYLLQNYSAGTATSYNAQNLLPDKTYTYRVEAVRPGGNTTAINTMQIHTSGLDAPVAMEAMNVSSNSFMANWEDALYATGYLLDVFTLSGQAETTETEEFTGVSSAGTPLPSGWTGTASGNYTTSTSSGIAPPSVALKNNGEWLQTKTYPAPVSKLSFMYRFASVGTNSLGVYGLSNGVWTRIDSIIYVNTTKAYPVHTFTKSQAMNAFRFIYHKSSGNLAIDDVVATYGSQDTVYVYKNEAVTGNQFEAAGLNEQTDYYYKVRSTLESSVSGYSETIDVQTTTGTALKTTLQPGIHLTVNNENILIWGLKGNETVRIYTSTGVCIYQQNAKGDRLNLDLAGKGVFIVKVQNNEYRHTAKFIR